MAAAEITVTVSHSWLRPLRRPWALPVAWRSARKYTRVRWQLALLAWVFAGTRVH